MRAHSRTLASIRAVVVMVPTTAVPMLIALLTCGCITHHQGPVVIRSASVAPPTEEPGGGLSLNITTFNVWGLPSWVNGASSRRYATIARELDRGDCGIVLLQEVWTRRCHRDLGGARGKTNSWWTAGTKRRAGLLGQNGLLTLSKNPIEDAEFRAFQKSKMPDALMTKGALKTTVRVGRRRINIWNVHLQADDEPAVRLRQIAELVRWVRAADDGQVADIVGGDFNCEPGSREFRELTAAIGPSVHQLAGVEELPTWDGLGTAHGPAVALDHLFIRLRHGAEEVTAAPRRIFTAAKFENRLSDHMGVEATVTISEPREMSLPVLFTRVLTTEPASDEELLNP